MNSLRKKLLILSLICFSWTAIKAHDVYIIIHGTWSCGTAWANSGGDFFDALEKNAPTESNILPYTWSGSTDNASREHAARGLVKLIKSYPPKTNIHLIAHSHGANVGIVASQMLAKEKDNHHFIADFYAMGAPVHMSSYAPAMNVIAYFYNLFSFEDFVQPVFGFFERIYPEHPRIANLRVFLNGKQPGHSELHDPLVGQLIPHLPAFLHANKCTLSAPGIIYLTTDAAPTYKADTDRERLLQRDKQMIQLLATSLSPQ
ncbi:hypothetical protein CVU75_00165 [Candidatus Dependentiae bacterium HGW-Dependentiae-1]|nr:MAG: hypothetical protein CVU75_00165 [Candidatus Dependentiae bacterium HGW-Dependentiae-1]